MRGSEERYRQLFESNPLPMWLYDLETLRFLSVNESAVQHYGYTREEFLAMTIKDIRNPEDVPAMLKSVDEGRSEKLGISEWRHRRKDGAIVQVEIRSRPLVFNGREARLVLATDVTEKKLLEEKFLHAQRLESIGMLAAGIAHDLNNVLAPIVFAAPLLRDSLTAPRDLKILDTLERSAGRGAGLVKQILGFVHTTSGEFRPTQVKHLARDIINVIEETFPKSIRLEHEIPSDLWPVQGNATQIHQVLLNLCVNARDAMPQGGTLRFTAANCRLNAAEAGKLPGARPGDWLALEITDTGTGISPEVLEHMGTPFFTTKREGKGTGLGFSTVRSIVLSHHGFIKLETEVGRGTTVRVFLPAVEGASPQQSSASPFVTPEGHGELILVADDDKAIREMVAEILGNHGYRVLSCSDGVEAVKLIYARPGGISLVVTDADMPRLDGVALVRTLLQLRPEIRLLAMSGLSREETGGLDLTEIQKLAHAFLAKPFKPEDLLGAVHELLHPAVKT
jgi:PAS domain S-box-containing protein